DDIPLLPDLRLLHRRLAARVQAVHQLVRPIRRVRPLLPFPQHLARLEVDHRRQHLRAPEIDPERVLACHAHPSGLARPPAAPSRPAPTRSAYDTPGCTRGQPVPSWLTPDTRCPTFSGRGGRSKSLPWHKAIRPTNDWIEA